MTPEKPERPWRILLAAGEASGDLHGAAVARALRKRWPAAVLYGLGGDRMAAEGVELLAHTRDLAVMGFVEVLRHLPFFRDLEQRLNHELENRPPDLIIPIDYPGFNLRLARTAKRLHIPVLYFIAPQVWAWHRSRMRQLAENTDRLAVVLPFEEKLFREAGARVHFVGHPLVDVTRTHPDRATFARALDLDADKPILALFPGSRLQELRRHLDLFAGAAKKVREKMPEVQPVIAAAPDVAASIYSKSGIPYTRDGEALLFHARAALAKSGTTTLQTGLAGVPLVITYQMHPLSYMLARHLVEVPHIGLVNLVAGARVAPELIQDEATPETLSAALLPLLREGPERERALEGLSRVRALLAGDPTDHKTAADRVVDLAAELLEQ